MRNYIIADNQELTRFALESLLQKEEEENVVFRAYDRAGLVALLKEHENAVVLLDYTLFDFADEDQLLIIAERFSLSDWVLISDELTPQFIRRVVYSSHQFSVVFKDGPLSEVREALNEPIYKIIDAVKATLEKTPPELAADVMDHGIMMTGGGALLTNLDKLLSRETGMPVLVSEDALSCVGEGTGRSLENIELLKRVVMTTKKLK